MKRSQKIQFIIVSVIVTGLLLLSSVTALADDYYVQWKKSFGGSGDDFYTAAKATFYRDMPGCIAVGFSYPESFGNGDWTGVEGKGGTDAIIVKYDHGEGNVLWKKNFGGSSDDNFYGIAAVPEGYIAVGRSRAASFGTGDWTGVTAKGYFYDAIIIKYDYEGELIWKKNFGGDTYNIYYSVTDVSDGFVAVGISGSGSFGSGDWVGVEGKGGTDAIIVKYDNNGDVVWKKNFGGSEDDQYQWVTEVPDGIIAAGYSVSGSFGAGDWTGIEGKGSWDAIIVKYDHNGNVIWKKNFGGSGIDIFNSVIAVSDGYIAEGYAQDSSFGNGDWVGVTGKGGEDAIIVKYDYNGNVVWKKNFGGNDNDFYWTATAVSDGIVAIGSSGYNSFNNGDLTGIMGKGNSDAIMVKYDYAGNILWKGSFGGSGSDAFVWATETMTGFVMVGHSSEASFGNGDWTGVEGKGGWDGSIVRFASYITTFIPVTNIINVPTQTKVGVPLTLSGQVVPGNATYQAFTWSIKNAGTTGATLSNGNILNTTATGVVTVTAIIENGTAVGVNFTKDFVIAVNAGDFVSVTNIIDVPTATTVGVPLTLTGTVVPSNATNKTIVWSIKNAGTTGATLSGGNILNTTAIGTVIVKATIANGVGIGVDFTKEFTIAVNPEGFISVIDIINVPQFTAVGVPLTLTGTVVPSNATYQTIVWSMKNAGGTGAVISTTGESYILTPTMMVGKVVVTATIENGAGIGIDFIKDFTIAINSEDFVPVIDIIDVPTLATEKKSLTLTGTVVPDNATNKTIIWSVKDAGGTGAVISGNIFRATKAGTAIITATIANGIGIELPYFKDFDIIVEKEDVAISELSPSNKHSLIIAPNPVSGIVTISATAEIEQLNIFDVMGRLVKSQSPANRQVIFDTGVLPKGVYLVQVRLKDGGVQTGKIIVR